MDYTPLYWGTTKGKIIEAIAVHWCFEFWKVHEATHIESAALYDLIGQLMSENIVYVYEGQYRVKKEIYHEYWDYAVHFTDLPEKIHEDYMETLGQPIEDPEHKGIINWINEWIEFQKNYDIQVTLKNNHLYLDGSILPTFIHDLVRRATNSIIYVSPWVEEIGVTKNLMNASKQGKNVVVVTREPDWSSKSDWGKRQAEQYEKCHNNLSESGISVCYNNEIHGKVLVVDNQIAVVSSFNLLKNPASGLSWEAGIITHEAEIVQSINESIKNMIPI